LREALFSEESLKNMINSPKALLSRLLDGIEEPRSSNESFGLKNNEGSAETTKELED
jgi:hypothetical protein